MINKIVNSLNLNWKDSSILPSLHNCNDNNISNDLILLFDDGFIVRGYYDSELGWFGYNGDMRLEHYIIAPSYYIEI